MVPTSFSYLRVWLDSEGARIARDRYVDARPFPEHLVEWEGGMRWEPHEEGGFVPAITRGAFIDWIGRGGTHAD